MLDIFDVHAVFEKQRQKSLEIRRTTAAMRVEKLKALRGWIILHAEDIRKALYADLGKAESETDITELSLVLAEISHAVKYLSRWMKPKKVKSPLQMLGSTAYIVPEPKGCGLILSPWNYPFTLCIGPLVSAIAAGCTAWLKPSEMTPHTSALIGRMVGELFEPNEVTVSEGGVEVAERLLSLPFDHIFFTGSSSIGKLVLKAASSALCSVTLELGGKSPVIIDKDCDLEAAADKVAWSKFLNCGQTCVAPDYVLVHEAVYADFKSKLKKSLIRMGDPSGKGIRNCTDYSRIVNQHHWRRLKKLHDEAVDGGARVVYGGERDEQALFYSPTILQGVTNEMDLMKEEIFGPILPMQPFAKLEEAIEAINTRHKPLALYLFSNSADVKERVLSKTSSGAVCINECAVHFGHPYLPFGGVGYSGIGKAHGHYGFLAFSNEKAILRQSWKFSPVKAFYPPYTAKTKTLIRFFLKWV
nr:aldehyde dehydrogenase family protein [Cytophagales bacterium]